MKHFSGNFINGAPATWGKKGEMKTLLTSVFSVFLFVPFCGFNSRGAIAAPTVIDRLEASVNSDIILLSDIQKFRKVFKLRSQLDPLFAGTSLSGKGPTAPEQEVAEFLIDERLIAQNFPVSDSEVEQEISNIQTNNHLDRVGLKSALKEQGFAFEEYFELIRTSASKRNLIDREIRTKVTISDDDIRNYFYNHYTRQSSTPLTYHLGIIAVSLRTYKNATAARDAAARALESIKGGDTFEEVAKRVSDDASAQTDGDMGELSSDQMSPLIRDEAKKLKAGQISAVFGGQQAGAYYIIKLIDVKSADSDRLSKMKEEIRSQLASTEYQHQISLWLERQRQKAFIHHAGDPSIAGLPKTL